MADEKIKKRIERARKTAVNILEKTGYKIISSDNKPFSIVGVRDKEIRLIRIILDEISESDINLVRKYQAPGLCTKEIWCKGLNKRYFVMKNVD